MYTHPKHKLYGVGGYLVITLFVVGHDHSLQNDVIYRILPYSPVFPDSEEEGLGLPDGRFVGMRPDRSE